MGMKERVYKSCIFLQILNTEEQSELICSVCHCLFEQLSIAIDLLLSNYLTCVSKKHQIFRY
jgi:hypothetical protein